MRSNKKIRAGIVVSDKIKKTIVVRVERLTKDPNYGKTIKKFKKYKAHDEENSAKIGDGVKIIETKPLSKEKCWRLLEIVKKNNAS